MKLLTISILAGLAVANPALLKRGTPTKLPPGGVTAVGTFNSFTSQVAPGSGQDTNCGSYDPDSFTVSPFGAAVADQSKDLAFSPCVDPSVPSAFPTACSTTVTGGSTAVLPTPTSGYKPPNCKKSVPCNTCFKVTNKGALGQWSGKDVGGTGNCAYVKIVDSCPHNSAYNYCKQVANPLIPANQRCSQPGQNALDIDQHAYQELTGIDFVAAAKANNTPPNLNILVQNVDCSAIPKGKCTPGGSGSPTDSGGQTGSAGKSAAPGKKSASGGKPAGKMTGIPAAKGGKAAQTKH